MISNEHPDIRRVFGYDMKKGTKIHRILLSFVGTNDAGRLRGLNVGAILTIFKKMKFDSVHLLWNPTKHRSDFSFQDIAEYVRDEILKISGARKVVLHRFDCDDVTDHNEIYPKLLSFCLSLSISRDAKVTAAIASGTPAMQACWILMAESGDFPLELIRSNEARFGKAPVTIVKLGTALPRILRLQRENEELKEGQQILIPKVEIKLHKGQVLIGKVQVPLSPIEFSYYRYFVERSKLGMEPERFSGVTVPREFLKSIIQFHRESFPDAELFRKDIEDMLKRGHDLGISTFRANIAKANLKIRKALDNPGLSKLFEIGHTGKRMATLYGISVPPHKISIRS